MLTAMVSCACPLQINVFNRPFTLSLAACLGHVNRVPVLSRVALVSCQQYSTKITQPAEEEEVVQEPPGIFKRMWRWLIDSDDMDTDVSISILFLCAILLCA